MEKASQLYEIDYLLGGNFSEDALSEEVKKMKSTIEENKGIILEEAQPKNQRLAYPIKKIEQAYFGWIQFSIKPEDLIKTNQTLGKNNSLLRYLITTKARKQTTKTKIIRPQTKRKKTDSAIQEKPAKSEEIDKQLEEILGE